MKTKTNLRNIVSIVLPSILTFLILMEVSLRLGSYAYNTYCHSRMYARNYAAGKGAKNILCLGDSFTFGLGAAFNGSYPRQLRTVLEENTAERVNVIEGGRGSNTSSLLLKNLQKDIDRYSPDIVVIMIGCNNHWFLKDSSFFHLYKDALNLPDNVEYVLSNSRVYTLMKISWINLCNALHRHNGKSLKDVLVSESIFACGRGTELFAEGMDDAAMEQFKKAVQFDTRNYVGYLGLSHLWATHNDYTKAREAVWNAVHSFVQLLNQGGECNDDEFYYILNQVDRIYRDDNGMYERRLGFTQLKEYLEANLNNSRRKNLVKLIDAKLYGARHPGVFDHEVLEYDLQRICTLLKERGASVVLQTYPNHHGLSLLNSTIREISERYKVPLVDNEMIFERRVTEAEKPTFFVPDGHCTAQGYRLVAEDVYATLVDHNLVARKQDPPSIKDIPRK